VAPDLDAHSLRQSQIASMTDEELLVEVLAYQKASWGSRGLPQHLASHGDELAKALGYSMDQDAYAELSKCVRNDAERVFTALDQVTGDVTYAFAKTLPGRRAILLVITRAGLVRTMFLVPLERWLKSHPEMVEVSERVRRLRSGA
jgi:hypothetical protein